MLPAPWEGTSTLLISKRLRIRNVWREKDRAVGDMLASTPFGGFEAWVMALLPVAVQVVRNGLTRWSVLLLEFADLARRRWYVSLPLVAIWVLAYLRVFSVPVPHIPMLFNWTPSVPYRVGLLRELTSTPTRGEYILYRFDGGAQRDYPGLRDQPFFKQVTGLPGDQIAVRGRGVFVNSAWVGNAKSHTFDGRPLGTIEPTVIPAGHYFVSGSSPDSFDSRYALSGLVRLDQIVGRVEPWF